ncbi:MAG: hypothetical protein AAB654_09620 [Acidobacteriota bacterium]
MNRIFFWMHDPPDGNILGEDWEQYLNSMAASYILVVLLAVLATVLIYRAAAARKKIHAPPDVFAPYTPIYWLCLSVPAGIVMAMICIWTYGEKFGDQAGGLTYTATTLALWTFLGCLLLGYLGILIPGITPPKFRYRPLWPFCRKRGLRTGGK